MLSTNDEVIETRLELVYKQPISAIIIAPSMVVVQVGDLETGESAHDKRVLRSKRGDELYLLQIFYGIEKPSDTLINEAANEVLSIAESEV